MLFRSPELELTLYTDVRMRRQLELRQCDTVPPEALPALPALATGLFYDVEARRRCLDLLRDGESGVNRVALRAAACRDALDAVVDDWPLRAVAREALSLARAGLERHLRTARGDGAPDLGAADALVILEEIVAGERPPFWAAVTRGGGRRPGSWGSATPPERGLAGPTSRGQSRARWSSRFATVSLPERCVATSRCNSTADSWVSRSRRASASAERRCTTVSSTASTSAPRGCRV